MAQTSVGIRELKAHLSAYIQHVKNGDIVIITEHGKPVGQIMPIRESIEERMQALIDAGFLLWSGERLQPVEPLP